MGLAVEVVLLSEVDENALHQQLRVNAQLGWQLVGMDEAHYAQVRFFHLQQQRWRGGS